MFKKLWRLCMIAVFAAGLFAVSDTVIKPVPPTAAAVPGGCYDDTWHSYHMSMANNPSAGNVNKVSGIRADLKLVNALCSWTSTEDSDDRGASAWVGIQCNSLMSTCGSEQLIQIGILRCWWTDSGSSGHLCNTYQGQAVFFWAAAGCNGYHLEPHFIAFPSAGATATYSFKLVMEAGNVLAGYIADPVGSWRNVVNFDLDTNPRVSCWKNAKTMAPIDFERFDSGDSYGNSANKARASNILWQRPDFTGWQSPGYTPSAACSAHRGDWDMPGFAPDTKVYCDVVASDEFAVWNQ